MYKYYQNQSNSGPKERLTHWNPFSEGHKGGDSFIPYLLEIVSSRVLLSLPCKFNLLNSTQISPSKKCFHTPPILLVVPIIDRDHTVPIIGSDRVRSHPFRTNDLRFPSSQNISSNRTLPFSGTEPLYGTSRCPFLDLFICEVTVGGGNETRWHHKGNRFVLVFGLSVPPSYVK